MTMRGVAPQNLRRAFHYHWRLWTIPELHDMLMGAGFSRVNVWLRPMQVRLTTAQGQMHGPAAAQILWPLRSVMVFQGAFLQPASCR